MTSTSEAVKPVPRLQHIRELDGIRGIAVMMVIFHHLCYGGIDPGVWGPWVERIRTVARWGSFGVDVFFVLSGFLITSLLVLDRKNPSFYQDFYWKRALRILPLYVFCLLLTLFFFPHSGSYVLFASLFIANFSTVFHINPVGGPFWSLAIEEQFYLLWPTVVRLRKIAQLAGWSLAVGLGCIALRLLLALELHHNYSLTYLHCDGLALGAFLACRVEKCRRGGRPATDNNGWLLAMLGVSLVLLCIAFCLPPTPRAFALSQALIQTGSTLLFGGAIGLCITNTGARATALLRGRILTFFGLISYALYMLHLFIIEAYDALHPMVVGNGRGYAVRIAVIVGLSILFSLISRYVLELPVLRLRKRVVREPAPIAETELPLVQG